MRPISQDILRYRVTQARQSLSRCDFCEHRCGADRFRQQSSPCGQGVTTRCFKHYLSFAEEFQLLPSYMVYLSGCNFRCDFCCQAPACLGGPDDEEVTPREFAQLASRAVTNGAKTINLVGGEPSIHVHTILEIAAASPRPLPLVLNSNMFMSPHVLEWLDGVISLYLADLKFGNDDCARRLCGVEGYLAIAHRNLKLAAGQGNLLVRHLLLPGHLECCFYPLVQWMAANLPGAPFHVMSSYVQGWRSRQDAHLRRLVSHEEIDQAGRWVRQMGLKEYAEELT